MNCTEKPRYPFVNDIQKKLMNDKKKTWTASWLARQQDKRMMRRNLEFFPHAYLVNVVQFGLRFLKLSP